MLIMQLYNSVFNEDAHLKGEKKVTVWMFLKCGSIWKA